MCKECKTLGKDELTFRQAQRDIDRTRGLSGAILRKHRSVFERFLAHPHPRIREYAEAVKREDEALRQVWRLEREYEEIEWEMLARTHALDEMDGDDAVIPGERPSSSQASAETEEDPWDEIPF